MGPKKAKGEQGKFLKTFRLENIFFGPTLCPPGALGDSITPPAQQVTPPLRRPHPWKQEQRVPPRDLRTASARGSSLFPSNSARVRVRPSSMYSPRPGGFCPGFRAEADGPMVPPSTLISSRMVCGPHLRCSLLNTCLLFNVWTGGEFSESLRPGCFLRHNSFFDSFLSSRISLSAPGRAEPLHEQWAQDRLCSTSKDTTYKSHLTQVTSAETTQAKISAALQ